MYVYGQSTSYSQPLGTTDPYDAFQLFPRFSSFYAFHSYDVVACVKSGQVSLYGSLVFMVWGFPLKGFYYVVTVRFYVVYSVFGNSSMAWRDTLRDNSLCGHMAIVVLDRHERFKEILL